MLRTGEKATKHEVGGCDIQNKNCKLKNSVSVKKITDKDRWNNKNKIRPGGRERRILKLSSESDALTFGVPARPAALWAAKSVRLVVHHSPSGNYYSIRMAD